jgi:hypothetical protein
LELSICGYEVGKTMLSRHSQVERIVRLQIVLAHELLAGSPQRGLQGHRHFNGLPKLVEKSMAASSVWSRHCHFRIRVTAH